MPISDDYLHFMEDQLEGLPELTHRRIFGGAGLYSEGFFFAVLDDDTLYLKVSDLTRPDFEKAGMGALDPHGDPDRSLRGYYQVPPQVVENRDALRVWAEKAVQASRRAAAADTGGSRGC